MSSPYTEKADQVLAGLAIIGEGAPEVAKAFGTLSVSATTTKSLDTKTKELMALAIGTAVHREGCVAFHARSAFKAGATRQELVETVAAARRWSMAAIPFAHTISMPGGGAMSAPPRMKELQRRIPIYEAITDPLATASEWWQDVRSLQCHTPRNDARNRKAQAVTRAAGN